MAPQDSKENKILSSKIKEEGKIIQKVSFKNMRYENVSDCI